MIHLSSSKDEHPLESSRVGPPLESLRGEISRESLPRTCETLLSTCFRCPGLGRCARLECLYVSSPAVTDASVAVLAKACGRLEDVDLSFCDISDVAVAALVDHCPRLASLGLRECARVTDDALRTLCRGALVRVDITECDAISERAARSFIMTCASLKHLDFRSENYVPIRAAHGCDVLNFEGSLYLSRVLQVPILRFHKLIRLEPR